MALTFSRSLMTHFGFLTHKYDAQSASDNDDDVQELTASSDFTQQLDRGGLLIPKFSTVYFVHSAVHIISKLSSPKASYITLELFRVA